MNRRSAPGEDNLTFLLCELLDERSSDLHLLEYSLSKVREKLAQSETALDIDISFETHAFSRHYEGKYSGADLGLLISVDHPVLGTWRGGALLQAKKLFHAASGLAYALNSRYKSFDKEQAKFLSELGRRYHAYHSIHYLWYNPTSIAFSDSPKVKAFEALTCQPPLSSRIHRDFFDESHSDSFHAFNSPDALEEKLPKLREWIVSQPALRLTDVDVVRQLLERDDAVTLERLYTFLANGHGHREFTPFATFMLEAVLSREFCGDTDWIALVEGKLVKPKPPSSPNSENTPLVDESPYLPTPRHTLRITVTSSLNNATRVTPSDV